MNKKDLVVVALATFCLTATLFMILPSRGVEREILGQIQVVQYRGNLTERLT